MWNTWVIQSKQDQRREYHLWANSSCTSGTEQATRVQTMHSFELNTGGSEFDAIPAATGRSRQHRS
jgi:hypothetical protein